MAKRPDHMTPEERLTRILSLERKVLDLENRLHWADQAQKSAEDWGRQAWEEVRRLHAVCSVHWHEKQEYRVMAGLEREDAMTPLAEFDHNTREWIAVGAQSGRPEVER